MPGFLAIPLAAALSLAPSAARAAFLSGDTLDTVADWVAIFVLIIVPVGVVILFWMVHVLPEKVAEKRHHPQKDAITTLCLLSLAFGGLLWPLAWLWAYTRPVSYRLAYGTDKHENYFLEMGAKAKAGGLLVAEIDHLRQELDGMARRGPLPAELSKLREDLDDLHAQAAARAQVEAASKVRDA